jgi:hypothetical protein
MIAGSHLARSWGAATEGFVPGLAQSCEKNRARDYSRNPAGEHVSEDAEVDLLAEELHRHHEELHRNAKCQGRSDTLRGRHVEEENQYGRGDDTGADSGDSDRDRNDEA